MRTTFRVLTIILLGVLAALGPSAASAGGPTSAIIVDPTNSRTSALYYSDDGYNVLMQTIGSPTEGPTTAPKGAGVGRYLTVTWLIHDVMVWRVDRIFTDTEGKIWIATGYPTESVPLVTDAQTPAGPWPDAEPVWHQASDSDGLRAFLTSALKGTPVAAPTSAAAPTSTVTVAAPSEVGGGGADPVWWGAGGMLLGAAAVLAVTRWPRRTIQEVPAGQEIYIDLDPQRA